MARDSGEIRTVGVGGNEYTFERGAPDKERKIGDRKLAAVWVAPMPARDGTLVATATVNEFDDGVLYGPSSIPGVVSDFAGAAAAEVTVRWLEMATTQMAGKLRRQRDIALGTAGAVAAVAVAVISFLK
jgi:hypothetical protein